MSTSSQRPGPQSARFPLRLPLIAMLGVMTMGSGLGNPGCGSSDHTPSPPAICDDTCDVIAGTYALTFPKLQLVGDCERLGLKLPTEMKFARDGEAVKGSMSDIPLAGRYEPGTRPRIVIEGESTQKLADGNMHRLSASIVGQFNTVPASASAPSTYTGHYYSYRLAPQGEPSDNVRCDISADFTATRIEPWGG
ncbi:hypothetical protein [Melittangium boletus]|uniref:hypothetical protein n=1 Tax=Melittangium boletus TaxID=83453 RepID=UPI003DA4AB62